MTKNGYMIKSNVSILVLCEICLSIYFLCKQNIGIYIKQNNIPVAFFDNFIGFELRSSCQNKHYFPIGIKLKRSKKKEEEGFNVGNGIH